MLKNLVLATTLSAFPLLGFACGTSSVSKTIDRVAEAAANGNTDEVIRTTTAILSGALGGAMLGAPAAPTTLGIAPVVGAVIGAACGCAVSNATAGSP